MTLKITTALARRKRQNNANEQDGAPRLARVLNGFRALRVRNYRLYWIGQLVSLTGTWMQSTAQAWLVLQLTHSPFALGLVATLQFLPVMLFSLLGGVLSDRLPRHRLIVTTQTVALIQATIFGILVATGTIQLWHVYVLAAIQGLVNAIDSPARQAFGLELVGREYVVNAVALNSMLFNGARIVGPALAGLIIARFGIAPALFLNALSFVAVLVALMMMDLTKLFSVPRTANRAPMQQLGEGLQYVWRTPRVLMVMIVVATIGTFGYNFSTIMPLLAGFVLHTQAVGFGSLSAFLGVGSLIGAVGTAYTRQVTPRRLLIGSAAFGIIFAGVALSTHFALTAFFLVLLGFAGIIFSTTANSLLQLEVPDALRGRVLSLYFLLFAGSTPIGSLLIGALSGWISVPAALLICAALCVVGVMGAFWYERRHAA